MTWASLRRSHRQGQSLVEFALVMPFLLLLVAGGIDFARAYSSNTAISDSAREAGLYATAHPGYTYSQLQSVAAGATQSGLGCSNAVVSSPLPAPVPLPTTATGGTPYTQTVTVTCDMPLFVRFVPFGMSSPVHISSTVTVYVCPTPTAHLTPKC